MIPERDRPEEFAVYGDRGVYVPEGMTAAEIMAVAEILEEKFDMAPYTSREAARAIIAALRKRGIRV